MSDLIEKVARAIARQRWTEEAAEPNLIDAEVESGWDTYADEASAAITAVAEWIEAEAAYGRERRVSDILKKQLEAAQ